jgi:hypothetical protein
LKWLGLLGRGSGEKKNRRLKEAVTTFFDGVMKVDRPAPPT